MKNTLDYSLNFRNNSPLFVKKSDGYFIFLSHYKIMLRHRIDPNALQEAFLRKGSYSVEQRHLIAILSQFIPAVIQDDACIQNQSHGASDGERLHDIMCSVSMAFVPIPVADSMRKKGNLVNDQRPFANGSYGRVYESVFEGNPLVTKAPTQFDPRNIVEIFVNMVIVSTLMRNNITTALIPSYGLFICPSNVPSNGDPLVSSKALKICNKGKNDKPSIFLLQKKLQGGKTLTSVFNSRRITMNQFVRYMSEIYAALIVLAESPFHLSHNDLHSDNIMICDDHAYILDYGMAAFYDATHLYQPFLYDDYIGKKPVRPLHTGALDLFEIIKSVYFLTERNPPQSELYEIHQLVARWMNQFSLFFRDGSTPIANWITYLPKVGIRRFYLLDLLVYVEAKQSGEQRRRLHEYHITQLQQLTPRFIMNTFFPRIFNWAFIDQHVALVQRAGLFDIPAIVPRAVVAPVFIPERPNVAPIKACGPKQGQNRWTKPELEQLARQRGINPYQSLHELCRALGLPPVPMVAPVQVVAPVPMVAPVQVVAPVPVVAPVKVCGPKQGENRWTKPELEQLAKQSGINPHQSLDKLCKELHLPNRLGCMCDAIIASGKKKGQRCNRPCTHGTRCGLH